MTAAAKVQSSVCPARRRPPFRTPTPLVGGAVATGSHGSSLAASSLSSPQQLLGLEMVASDGSLRHYTPEQEPFLFRVRQPGVGKGLTTASVRFWFCRQR